MVSHKKIQFEVNKEDYMPVNNKERDRVREIMIENLIGLVEKFDGSVAVKILFETEGNI